MYYSSPQFLPHAAVLEEAMPFSLKPSNTTYQTAKAGSQWGKQTSATTTMATIAC